MEYIRKKTGQYGTRGLIYKTIETKLYETRAETTSSIARVNARVRVPGGRHVAVCVITVPNG